MDNPLDHYKKIVDIELDIFDDFSNIRSQSLR